MELLTGGLALLAAGLLSACASTPRLRAPAARFDGAHLLQ